MNNSIVHLQIGVPNLPDGVKFYKLAFPEWKIEKASFPDYYFVNNEGGRTNLSIGIGLVDEVQPRGNIIFYVDVGDIPAAMQRITEAGGKILIEKTPLSGENGFISRFEDPFGNLIGIWSES
ncbi:MAG: VOC family protein [Candidatus Kariarchaeaceae archaeon]|jgi:predicted enzyme related to lactoylglutathione lyase